jgi:putative membrane protein
MFKDYLALMLVNMTGGLVVLALYSIRGAGKEDQRAWCPALAAPGLVALLTGLHMALTWPLPKLEHISRE